MKPTGKIHLFLLCLAMSASCSTGVNTKKEQPPKVNVKLISEKLRSDQLTYNDLAEVMHSYEPILKKQKVVGDFLFDATYQPHLQLAISNNDSIQPDQIIKKADLETVSNYGNLHSIHFSMENKKFKSELLRYNLQSVDEYSQRISYYSFYCNTDCFLVENATDTIRGAFVNFERTFDISPKLNFTFVFESRNTKPLERLNFVFNDVIFNNGKLNFEFDYKTISTLNAVEIKKVL